MDHCSHCGTALERRPIKHVRRVAGHVFKTTLAALSCPSCRAVRPAERAIEDFDLRLAVRLADSGITQGDGLKVMRTVIGLSGKELAALLGVRPETVSHWEQSRPQINRAAFAVVRQLVLDRAHGSTSTADWLKSLQSPKRLRKYVALD